MLGILVGLIGGTLSGLTGLGGGFIMVPLRVFFFGMTQHAAQGTSLAVLLPPLGGWSAQVVSGPALRKGFAVVMALIATDMFFRK